MSWKAMSAIACGAYDALMYQIEADIETSVGDRIKDLRKSGILAETGALYHAAKILTLGLRQDMERLSEMLTKGLQETSCVSEAFPRIDTETTANISIAIRSGKKVCFEQDSDLFMFRLNALQEALCEKKAVLERLMDEYN